MHAPPVDSIPSALTRRANATARRLPLTLASAIAALLTAGCSLPLQSARMVLPPDLVSVAPVPFNGLGSGRSGRFSVKDQTVQFRRMGDALSVLDRLRLDRVSVQFDSVGAPGSGEKRTAGRCDGRAAVLTAESIVSPLQPMTLSCRFTGEASGELLLRELRVAGAGAGARQAREGQARFGSIVIDIRSEHALVGSPLPLSQPAGYRLMIGGRDVAALDLAGGKPLLRRAPGLDEPARSAITAVALALGLLFEPAVTLG